MRIEEIFDRVSVRMRADFERARLALSHPGMKGEAFEEVFRTFLRQYLPKSLEVTPGVLIDTAGKESRQLDAIIFDAHQTPILFASGEDRVIPVECAYAVVEVKARLDGEEIERIFTNMKSVRALTKKAWRPLPLAIEHTLYGKKWDIWPVMYFVFAFDSMDLRRVGAEIDRRHKAEHLPEWSRIDTVCVLDKGVIENLHPNGKRDTFPVPGSRLIAHITSKALLLFYLLIFKVLAQATMPLFSVREYLMDVAWGELAEISER